MERTRLPDVDCRTGGECRRHSNTFRMEAMTTIEPKSMWVHGECVCCLLVEWQFRIFVLSLLLSSSLFFLVLAQADESRFRATAHIRNLSTKCLSIKKWKKREKTGKIHMLRAECMHFLLFDCTHFIGNCSMFIISHKAHSRIRYNGEWRVNTDALNSFDFDVKLLKPIIT